MQIFLKTVPLNLDTYILYSVTFGRWGGGSSSPEVEGKAVGRGGGRGTTGTDPAASVLSPHTFGIEY